MSKMSNARKSTSDARPSVMPCLRSLSSMSRDHIADLSRTLGLVLGRSSLRGGSKKRRSVRKRRILRDSSVRTFLYNNNPFKSDELLRSKIGISLFATVEEEAKDCTNCINKRTLHFPLIQ